jgi:hypothetical protein
MRFRTLLPGALAAAAGAMVAATTVPATAQTGMFYPKVNFGPQDADVQQVLSAVNLTRDAEAPARGFTGPSAMAVDPTNSRVIVAATADLRSRICYLTVSRDAGRTWNFSSELPGLETYPFCTNNTAGVPTVQLKFGSNGVLYYARQAYGEGEGPREGKSSILLSRTTDLGSTWETTMVEDNRGKTGETAPSATGVHGLAVDTSGAQDVVHVGYTRSHPDSPTGSPLRRPSLIVATSTDGGRSFAEPVNLNATSQVNFTISGQPVPLIMRTGFGAPFMFARNGTLLVVAGPEFEPGTAPPAPEDSGSGGSSGSWFHFALPQLIARSTDQGRTFSITTLSPPRYDGTGAMTGLGWTSKGGPNGTIIAVHAATPPTSPTSGVADIVMQRSTDDGVTWSEPLALGDARPDEYVTAFYPNLSVAPNGRVDVIWQSNRGLADNKFRVEYTYSTDGGETWAPNMTVSDQPLDFNYGISFNSDLRYPPGVASTNQFAVIGWAEARQPDPLNETQDVYGTTVQFAPLPATANTTAPILAAAFGGLVVAGVVLLLVLRMRGGGGASPQPSAQRQAAAAG